MKNLFSVSEMSKIVDIPANTLKYYDRIDLFKPAVVNEKSLYRYYTKEQIYTLVLIKDLRALNMSIQEIRDYLDNRNFNKSLDILQMKLDDIDKRSTDLTRIRTNLKAKIDLLKHNNSIRYEIDELTIKRLPERVALSYGVCIKNDGEKYFASRQLEKAITDTLPGIICCTHGAFISKEELKQRRLLETAVAFVFITDQDYDTYADAFVQIPAGRYLCSYYEGKMWDRMACLERMLDYIDEQGWQITGDALQINYIDDNLTDHTNEFFYEIQIPI